MEMEELPDPEDAEARKRQEEYLDSLVADCPAFPPDPRQDHFYEHVHEMRKDPEMKDMETCPMNGFRASAVDLGWLKDKCVRLVEEKWEEFGAYGLSALIDEMVARCVQRLKSMIVRPDYERRTFEVMFNTKDDEGHYEYRFAVPLPDEEEEEEDDEEAPGAESP